MKIVCGSCGAKYSIADEKIAGKVFKIQCKKCTASIIVRGDTGTYETQGAGPAEEEGPWHVVLDGEQKGPFTEQQLSTMASDGSIDLENYVWRDGFDGWKAIREVSELAALCGGAQEPAAAPSSAADPHDEFASEPPTMVAPTGSLPLPEVGSARASDVATHSAHASEVDLFAPRNEETAGPASPALSASSTGGASMPETGMPEMGAASMAGPFEQSGESETAESAAQLTGTRNENSVLFSLANLKSLGTQQPDMSSQSGPIATGPAPSSGRTTAENGSSGLIDIRALQNAADSTKAGLESSNVVLPVASRTAPFVSSLAAPSLGPNKSHQNKILWAAIGVIGLAVVTAIVLMVVLLVRDPDPDQMADDKPPPGTAAPQQGTPQGTATTPPSTPAGAAVATPQDTTPADKKGDSKAGSSSKSHSSKRSGSRSRSSSHSSKSSSASGSSKKSGGGSIDDLLDQALAGGGKSKGGGSSTSTLPKTPSRSEVLAALKSVAPAVKSCGKGKHGRATANVKVSGSTGRVKSVSVGGDFAGTPQASCIAKAVKRAKFPRFSKSSFSVAFPYSI